MTLPKNIAGQRFGLLTAVQFAGVVAHRARWVCRCDCGAEKVMMAQSLLAGASTCGGSIHKSLRMQGRNVTHGMTNSRTYEIWVGMRKRCNNPASHGFANYGGRGISVCEQWSTFAGFFRDMGNAPEEMEIDRIDVDGDYKPGNCRWVNLVEQANNRRNNRMVEHGGRLLTIAEYAEATGIRYATAYYRHVIRGNAPLRVMAKAHMAQPVESLHWDDA